MRFQDCKNSKELKQELLKVLSNFSSACSFAYCSKVIIRFLHLLLLRISVTSNGITIILSEYIGISRLRLTEIFIGYIIRIVGLFYKI